MKPFLSRTMSPNCQRSRVHLPRGRRYRELLHVIALMCVAVLAGASRPALVAAGPLLPVDAYDVSTQGTGVAPPAVAPETGEDSDPDDGRKLRIWQAVGAFLLGVLVASGVAAYLVRWSPRRARRR